jgi:hypothetical protein
MVCVGIWHGIVKCSSAADVPLFVAPRVGWFIETIENTAGGGSNHPVSTWTEMTADDSPSWSRLLLLVVKAASTSSTARDAIQ